MGRVPGNTGIFADSAVPFCRELEADSELKDWWDCLNNFRSLLSAGDLGLEDRDEAHSGSNRAQAIDAWNFGSV